MSLRSVAKSSLRRLRGTLEPLRRLAAPLWFRSGRYWERRYAQGGTSGAGSYGKRAELKASVVNRLIEEKGIRSVIEFGCGDGNQLRLLCCPRYVGLDVSPSAVHRCADAFSGDPTKSFFLYEPFCFVPGLGAFRADMALSLDVIFHLTEESVFRAYMAHLFGSATRVVVIYSSNHDERVAPHVRHRRFTDYVAQTMPEWQQTQHIGNPLSVAIVGEDAGSASDFYVYERARAL